MELVSCFYKYPHNIGGTLHDSRGYVSFVTAGVTYLSLCGFQCFLYGESAEFVSSRIT
jgi:hypothetical protein